MARFQAIRVGPRTEVVNAGTISVRTFEPPPEPRLDWPIAGTNMLRRGDPDGHLVVAAGKRYDPALALDICTEQEWKLWKDAQRRPKPESPSNAPEPTAQPSAALDGNGVEETGPPRPVRRQRR